MTTKPTVKTKKNHEFWILRDSLKMVVFSGISLFLQWFWYFFHACLVVFLGFYSGFELLTTGTAVITKNNHEF